MLSIIRYPLHLDWDDAAARFVSLCSVAENAILGLGITLIIIFVYSYLARILSHNVWEKNRIRK